MVARDLPQHLHAVHAGHVEVHGDHVGLQLFELAHPKAAIHGGTNHFDGAVAFQDLRNELAHERGVIHYQHAQFAVHARTSSAGCASQPSLRSVSRPLPRPSRVTSA